MTDRNFGKFCIDNDLIRENPDEVAQVFKMLNLVVVRAECLFTSNEIEYMGLSDHFEEVNVGEIAPEYVIEMTKGVDEDEQEFIESVKAMKQ